MNSETIFYMGLQVSKYFELEKEYLTIDNYYDSILRLVADYIRQGYNKKNMGLLESINEYINNNLIQIENILVRCDVSDSKDWKKEEK